MIRIVFLGTPAFSVPTLQTLLDSPEIEVLGVVTQPDKPSGRGQKLHPSPVKELAQLHRLTVQQPKSLRKSPEVISWLREQNPDFLVTIAFGQILSQEVLDIPTKGTVNVHASLLPELRGPNPIQWSILHNMPKTGLTTMLTDIGVDTGAMLLKESVTIDPNMTASELAGSLSYIAGPLLLKTLLLYHGGDLDAIPQAHDQATHGPKLSADDAVIDWTQSAQIIHNKIRGQYPWPGTVSFIGGERVKITVSRVGVVKTVFQAEDGTEYEKNLKNKPPGTILDIMKEGIRVQTGDGVLDIVKVQPPNKREMFARDWANGGMLKHKPWPNWTSTLELPDEAASESSKVDEIPTV